MQGHTIFLLEDNAEMSRMYERAFRLRGYQVILADDGVKALAALDAMKDKPSALILDIMVPKMNGLDLMRDLRSKEIFKDVPIVVLTNSFYHDDSARFLDAGADLYLVKIEHQIKEVTEKVEALIHNGRSSSAK